MLTTHQSINSFKLAKDYNLWWRSSSTIKSLTILIKTHKTTMFQSMALKPIPMNRLLARSKASTNTSRLKSKAWTRIFRVAARPKHLFKQHRRATIGRPDPCQWALTPWISKGKWILFRTILQLPKIAQIWWLQALINSPKGRLLRRINSKVPTTAKSILIKGNR